MEDLDAALTKAVDQATEAPAPAGQAPVDSTNAPSNENGTNTGTAGQAKAPAAAKAEKPVWDGKLESLDSLPEELREAAKEHAKSVQRYTTRLAQEAAEARKKAEDYEKRFPQDKQAQYERWLAEQAKPKPNQAPRISQEEWEDALLDTTGDKVNALLERQVQWKVDQARDAYMEQMSQHEKAAQERKALEDRVLEFASLNPSFEKLAKAGIMMPMLRDELGKGGTLETAYARATGLVESLKAERDVELKELAEKKKDASSFNKNTGKDDSTKWVNDYDEALSASIEAAISKRPVKVKIRPRTP